MKLKIPIICASLLFLVSLNSYGQFNFHEGLVVTWNNDTLHGYISDGGTMRNSKVCVFRDRDSQEVTRYAPTDIKEYLMPDHKYYVSRVISNGLEAKRVFLEVLLKGEHSLYHYFKGTYPHYYIEEPDGNLISLDDATSLNSRYEYNYPINWKSYVLGTVAYKDSLFFLFEDNPELLNKLNAVEYTHRSLMGITGEFIEKRCGSTGCITYARDLTIGQPGFGVYSGIQASKIYFYLYDVQTVITPSVPVGIFYTIPMSIFSDRLAFQAELLYGKTSFDEDFLNQTTGFEDIDISLTTLGVPLSIRYHFPGRKVIPEFGIGKETGFVIGSDVNYKTQRFNEDGVLEFGDVDFLVHRMQKGGWFLDAGASFPLAGRMKLYSNLRIQRNTNLIIESENYNNNTFRVAEETVYATRFNIYMASLQLGIRF